MPNDNDFAFMRPNLNLAKQTQLTQAVIPPGAHPGTHFRAIHGKISVAVKLEEILLSIDLQIDRIGRPLN
jgi:hypothetical protein